MDVEQLSAESKARPLGAVGANLGLSPTFASPGDLQVTVAWLAKHLDELRLRVGLLEIDVRRRWWITTVKKVDAKMITSAIAAAVGTQLNELRSRVAALEHQTKSLKYVGVYQRAHASSYQKNNAVTHDGSIWIALVDHPKCAPGQGGIRDK